MSTEDQSKGAGRPEEANDGYLKANDVQEIVNDDAKQGEPMSEDDFDDNNADPEDAGETIEIDMRNNSTTYFDQHTDSVYLIASHPTLPLVVSGGGDNIAYLWTTTHNPPKVAAKLTDHTESVVAGGFTANGKYLVTGDMSGRLIVWKSSASGEKWKCISNSQEVDEIVHISFHPTDSLFAVGASDGSIWCYEISDELVNIAVLNAHSLPTTATTFIPSNALEPKLFSVAEDGLLICWDVYGGRAIYTLGAPQLRGEHPWVSLALSPTGKTIAVGSMDGLVVLVKLEDGTVLRTVDTTTVKAEVPPKPNAAGTGATEGGSDGEEEPEEEGRSVEGLSWSDATNLLATGNVDGTIVLWDPQTWRPRSQFQLEDSVTKMRFVPKTKFLVVSGMDGSLSKFDVINSERVWECLGHNEGVLGFAIQNNGDRIISAGDDQVCLVFNKN